MCPLHYEMPFGYTGGIIMWILIFVVVVLAVYLALKSSLKVKSENDSETALDILKKRYAAGEISKEEFEEKKKDIL